ncbi:MAG: S9 family peptidase [Gemmatimonadota bacterium]
MTPTPPAAPVRPHPVSFHGETWDDPYFWLRNKEDPAVIAYLEAENAYADQVLAPTKELEERLYQEILGRIKQTDLSVPYRDSGFWYYTRTEEGKQYPIYCRKARSLDAPEQVTVDVNALAEGHTFMALGAYRVSPDGRLLAYSTDPTGFREYTLVVKDLETGDHLPLAIERVSSVVWAADSRTLFYTVEDDAKRPWRLFRHTLGSERHELVYEEPDELFRVAVGRTRSRAYLLLHIASHTTSEVRYLPAERPRDRWRLIARRRHEVEYDVEHHGDRFYLRINDTGRNFRIVRVPVDRRARAHWTEVLPPRDDVMLEGLDLFANHMVVTEREDGLPHFRVIDLRTGEWHRIDFPEPVYNAQVGNNAEFDTTRFRFGYESFVTPPSVFEYDMDSRQRTLLKETPVLGGYDRTQYVSERLHATAQDGTRVPVSLVFRKGLVRDGSAPLLLEGYGAYGIPYDVSFSSTQLSLLDRGFVCAIAHVRGGGELGKPWHDAGRMAHKMNTFTDFIACAEHLVTEGYTSAERLVIEGGSAGGLLMGAVTNMRPDLFRLVLSHVPFVDVLNTMSDPSLPLTVGEYEEWGNPAIEEQYRWMRAYSPYDNLKRGPYPAMLVRTSLNDSQVMYWEPAKYVARLRTLKTDSNPLLLITNMGAGHGGASGRYDRLREIAVDYAFVLWQLGVSGEPHGSGGGADRA